MKQVIFKIPDKDGELLEHIYTYEDIIIVPHTELNNFSEVTKNDIEYSKLYILNQSENTAAEHFYYKRKDVDHFINTNIPFPQIYNELRKDYLYQKEIENEQRKINAMLNEAKAIDEKYGSDKEEPEEEIEENPYGPSPECGKCALRDECPIDYRMGSIECYNTYKAL